MSVQLEQEVLRDILRRAEEIDAGGTPGPLASNHFEEMVIAAEEAGLSRSAISQALRERFGWQGEALLPDAMVWARSADGHSYLARVISVTTEAAKVRFMSGSDATVPLVDIREFSVMPGASLSYYSSDWSSWVTSAVIRYNEEARSVTFNYWGSEETITLDKVRLSQPSAAQTKWNQIAIMVMLFLSGGVVGTIVTWALTRR